VRDPVTLAPRPGVAERWESSEDGLRWTFHLRPDARWTDGERVTARDFAFSFERLLDPRTAAGYASQLYCVEGARAFATDVDEHGAPRRSFSTVAIERAIPRRSRSASSTPSRRSSTSSLAPQLCPVSEKGLAAARERFPETWGVEWLRPGQLVTNGPFRLLQRRANDRIRLGRFDGYWDARNVAMESIDALAVEQVGTALNLYLAGEVAWIGQQPSDLARRLAERPDFRSTPTLGTEFYRVNVARPPFDDARVRRALALAIDREAIVRKVTRCGEQPLYACVPPGIAGWQGAPMRHAESFEEDVAEARRLLAECGYGPGGRELPADRDPLNTRGAEPRRREVIADSWRRNLACARALENQEWRVFMDTQRRVDYDVSRSSWIADYADALGFLEIWDYREREQPHRLERRALRRPVAARGGRAGARAAPSSCATAEGILSRSSRSSRSTPTPRRTSSIRAWAASTRTRSTSTRSRPWRWTRP
jgi:oligopeptide transport system substrate-binding protein